MKLRNRIGIGLLVDLVGNHSISANRGVLTDSG